MDYCVYNSITTPDGTVLTCEHRHDYKAHEDKNGEIYMNDGGEFYVRRSVNKVPYIDNSVWTSHGHDKVRKVFSWGTYGKFGDEEYRRITLCDMETGHIEAIIDTQRHLPDYIIDIFKAELEYRNVF
jgi:hypothetical protein